MGQRGDFRCDWLATIFCFSRLARGYRFLLGSLTLMQSTHDQVIGMIRIAKINSTLVCLI